MGAMCGGLPHADRRLFLVDEEDAGSRLDVFLQEACHDLSRSRVQRLIAAGDVVVDDRLRRASHRVQLGERVAVEVPEAVPLQAHAQDIPLVVVYEDADLLVVDKAAGLAVHPAPGSPDGTLVNALLHHCRDLSGVNGVLRPGIVHRLDRDTTGLLVVAKNDTAHRGLAAQLEARTVERRYAAIVWGSVGQAGLVDAPLDRNPRDRKRMAVVEGGRQARTRYRVLREVDGYSLVEARPETGRTHQIRVHFASLGHPVAGDPLYGRKGGKAPLRRQFLHAQRLAFRHPRTNERLELEAPLAEDLEEALRGLEARA